MRAKLFSVAVVFLCVQAAALVESAEPLQVRILSYNIHHGEGVDRRLDLDRIAAVIREAKPDLVALQEVDERVVRTKSVDQPQELARRTQMEFAFGANIRLQGGNYGNMVLSRFPIKQKKNHLLPNVDRGEQRGVLEVEVQLPGSESRLVLLATHLDHRADDRERVASAQVINDLVLKRTADLAILAGDFNDTPGSATLMRFGQAWTLANTKAMPTIPVENPDRQIDFIGYRPADRWHVRAVEVLQESVASDHRPILAVIELRPRPAVPSP